MCKNNNFENRIFFLRNERLFYFAVETFFLLFYFSLVSLKEMTTTNGRTLAARALGLAPYATGKRMAGVLIGGDGGGGEGRSAKKNEIICLLLSL